MASNKRSKSKNGEASGISEKTNGGNSDKDALIEEHLPPMALVAAVMICSGPLFVFYMRDFLATGKVIAGRWDEDLMVFTKSMDWFDDAKGWKSQQGGLSAIKQATTDENNMGGFFVRKMAGAVGLAVQLQKLLPLLAHPTGAQWSLGHFRPLLYTAIITNFMNAAFFGIYLNDLKQAGAEKLVLAAIGLLILEAAAIGHYIFWSKTRRGTAIAMTEGKTPTSVASRIVSRTVALVTSVIGLIVIRDLCFPGYILELLPRDDIYLEWTNAFLHSPPEGSPEALEHGLEAPLYIGDKFIGQLMALNIVICCVYKLVSAFAIRYGSDGGGLIKAKILWKGMFFADGLMLLVFRLFVSAALTASLDLRWHVMALSYETFILGVYGFF